jgi:hypothetical protein
VLSEDDRVELLEGVVVATAPSTGNLRDDLVEVMRDPDPSQARYRTTRAAGGKEVLEVAALPGARAAVADLLPARS